MANLNHIVASAISSAPHGQFGPRIDAVANIIHSATQIEVTRIHGAISEAMGDSQDSKLPEGTSIADRIAQLLS